MAPPTVRTPQRLAAEMGYRPDTLEKVGKYRRMPSDAIHASFVAISPSACPAICSVMRVMSTRSVRLVTGWESEQMQFSVLNEPGNTGASVTSEDKGIRSITP